MKCKNCGSRELTIRQERIPGGIGENSMRTIYICKRCSQYGLLQDIIPAAPVPETAPDGIPFAIHSAIVDALAHAKEKHPRFADNEAEAGNVILEELLEVNSAGLSLVQKINDQASRDELLTELAQLNATTIRMMEMIINS